MFYICWGICLNFSNHRISKSDRCGGWWTSDFRTMNTGWIIAIPFHPMAWHLQEIQVGRVKSKSLRIHYVGTINLTQQFSLVMFCFFNSPRWDTHVVVFFRCQIPALQKSQVSWDSWQSHLLTKLFLTQPGGLGGYFGRQISKFASGWIFTASC